VTSEVPWGVCDCGQGRRIIPSSPDSPCRACRALEKARSGNYLSTMGTDSGSGPAHAAVVPQVRLAAILDPHRQDVSYLECLDEIEPWQGTLTRTLARHPQPYTRNWPGKSFIYPFWRILKDAS
jgi:hypothetical protein